MATLFPLGVRYLLLSLPHLGGRGTVFSMRICLPPHPRPLVASSLGARGSVRRPRAALLSPPPPVGGLLTAFSNLAAIITSCAGF